MGSQFISQCTADFMADAARAAKAGSLIAFPTETVYGIGADATNPVAVVRIYKAKSRPVDHPLIVHVGSMEKIMPWVSEIPEYAIALARTYWPGPMTLILRRSDLAQDFITGGQDTVGIRVPDHVVGLAFLEECHKLGIAGIAAPSANRFGHVSPTTAEAVLDELDTYLLESDIVLDGGASTIGLESTIVDCTGDAPRILRPGAISREMVEDVTGILVTDEGVPIKISGLLERHYSPQARVILDATPQPGDGLIADSTFETPVGVLRLSSPHNDHEFARELYSALRTADAKGIQRVVVRQPSGEGIAVAIRDRLLRASRGR